MNHTGTVGKTYDHCSLFLYCSKGSTLLQSQLKEGSSRTGYLRVEQPLLGPYLKADKGGAGCSKMGGGGYYL